MTSGVQSATGRQGIDMSNGNRGRLHPLAPNGQLAQFTISEDENQGKILQATCGQAMEFHWNGGLY